MSARPKILVTRPLHQASSTANDFAQLGYEPCIAPMMIPNDRPFTQPDLSAYQAIIFTSANAVWAFQKHNPATKFSALPVFAVGEKTGAAAHKIGFENVTCAAGDAIDLAKHLSAAQFTGPLLSPCAQQPHITAQKLSQQTGLTITGLVVYHMQLAQSLPQAIVHDLQHGHIKAVTLYSQRTAQNFLALYQAIMALEKAHELSIFCLSQNVAQPLRLHTGFDIYCAHLPNHQAMIDLAQTHYQRLQIQAC